MSKKQKIQTFQQDSHLVNNVKSQLFVQKRKPSLVFDELRRQTDYEDLRKTVKTVAAQLPIYKKVIFETVVAKSIVEVQNLRHTYYSKDIINDLYWYAIALESNFEIINKFLKSRFEYENAFLKADYQSAFDILNRIENDTGFSLWSIESRFILLEYFQGFEANKRFLSQLKEAKGVASTITLLMDFASSRAEKKISPENYLISLQKILRNLSEYKEYSEVDPIVRTIMGLN